MSRLTKSIVDAVHSAGVRVDRVDRSIARMWGEHRSPGDPPTFVGWYWHQSKRDRVVNSDKAGPFPCYSAAIADAFQALQLRRRA